MARLFITQREIDFISDLTKEVNKDVVGHKIYYYHVREDLSDTDEVYEEAVNKVYDPPIEIECRIDWGTPEVKTNQFGVEKMWNVEVFVHYRDVLDRQISLQIGDYFSYGTVFFEITTVTIEKFIFGSIERVAGYKLVGKQSRIDHINKLPIGPTEETYSDPDAIQNEFHQQRGKERNELGVTGDLRQLRKDGKLEEPITGVKKVSKDGNTAGAGSSGSSFYGED